MSVIGQCNKTVDTLYLCKWTVSDVVAHFAELIVVFLMKTYNWCLFSFSSFVIILSSFVWLIDNRTSSRPILSVNATPAARSSDFYDHLYGYRPNWTLFSPITIIYCTCINCISQVKNVWKVCGRVIPSTQHSNFTRFSCSSWTLDVKFLHLRLFLTFLTAICKWTDPTTERLSKKCYRQKLFLIMNVKPLTILIYPVRLRKKKEIKEAELVF